MKPFQSGILQVSSLTVEGLGNVTDLVREAYMASAMHGCPVVLRFNGREYDIDGKDFAEMVDMKVESILR